MKIKNYTSSVSVESSVAMIEKLVASCGASSVQKHYDAKGRISALFFTVHLPNMNPVSIRLPANAEAVYNITIKQYRRTTPKVLANARAQAERTAWKLMLEWVQIQMSLIQMNQVDFVQVFLPYVWTGKETFYEKIKASKYVQIAEYLPEVPHTH